LIIIDNDYKEHEKIIDGNYTMSIWDSEIKITGNNMEVIGKNYR
jgi:hypothetical protein